MKKVIVPLSFLCMGFYLSAQIPNYSFENWTSGEPNGWQSGNVQPTYVATTQSNQAHAGNSAAKIGVMNVSGNNTGRVVTTSFGTNSVLETDSLVGWYKSSFVGTDNFAVFLSMYSGGNTVAVGISYFSVSQSSYTRFAVPAMTYVVATIDSVGISLVLNNSSTQPNINSYAIVDDLHIGSSTASIPENSLAKSISVFPNPASSQINFTASEISKLEIFTMEGKLVKSETVNAGNNQLGLNNLPEGTLLMVLTNENGISRQQIIHTL